MVEPMRSIRVSDDVWLKAKRDALDCGLTLQEWVALCLLQGANNQGETKT